MSYGSTISADGPVSYWRLGEASGTNAADQQAANAGTYHGSGYTLGVAGPLVGDPDTAVSLGTDGYVSTAYTPFVSGASQTFEGWATSSAIGANQALLSGSGATAPSLYFDSPTALSWYPKNSAKVSWAFTWTDLTWRHWAVTYNDATGVAQLFINGASVSPGAQTVTTDRYATPGNLIMGAFDSAFNFFIGTIDEYAVYNTILTPTQIAAHYAAGMTAPTTAPSRTARGLLPRNTLRRGVRNRGLMALLLARLPEPAPASLPIAANAATADTSLTASACTRVMAFPDGARTAGDASLSATSATGVRNLPRATSDTSLSATTPSRGLALPRATSDTTVTTDVVTRSAVAHYTRSTADTSLSADVASLPPNITLYGDGADTSLSATATTRAIHEARATGDTSLSATARTPLTRFPRSTADTSTSADAITRQIALPRATSDTSLSSDATTRGALHYQRSTTDTSLSSDTATGSFAPGTPAPPAPKITPPTTATLLAYASTAAIRAYTAQANVKAYTSTGTIRATTSSAAIRAYISSPTIATRTSQATIVTYTSTGQIGPTLG